MERGGSRRGFQSDGKVRDYDNWERKGPLSPPPAAEAGPVRGSGRVRPSEGPRERRDSPSWGEQRSQDGSRPPREFRERQPVERQPTAAEMDNQWRSRMKPVSAPTKTSDGPTPEASAPTSPTPAPAATLATRPKLNLQKRTVSEAAPSPAVETVSSIFGGAKPIDTAAREREIEEKRQIAIRQKKEQEEKEREEKAKEEARKKEEAAAKAAAEKSAMEDKANGAEISAEGGKDEDPTDEGENNTATVEKPAAKDTKANGVSGTNPSPRGGRGGRVPPRGPRNDSGPWRDRRKPSAPSSPATPATEAPEEDGWSTVTKPQKRGTPRGARASHSYRTGSA